MSGYQFRGREPLRWANVLAGALALVAGILCLLFAAITVRLIPQLASWHGKVSPVAPVMWLLGSTFLMRANASSPSERFSPRVLRLLALLFFVMGLGLMILVAVL